MPSGRTTANENAPVAACKTYAEAQDIYVRTDWDGDGVLEYAQAITGDNSLFEKTAGSGDLQLVDQAFANASQPELGQAKAGYYFKVLSGQGPKAPGGRMSYLTPGANGEVNQIRGYALVAWPAQYDGTGRNTYIINHSGTVYQQDLGPDTAAIVDLMTEYEPVPGWVVAE